MTFVVGDGVWALRFPGAKAFDAFLQKYNAAMFENRFGEDRSKADKVRGAWGGREGRCLGPRRALRLGLVGLQRAGCRPVGSPGHVWREQACGPMVPSSRWQRASGAAWSRAHLPRPPAAQANHACCVCCADHGGWAHAL